MYIHGVHIATVDTATGNKSTQTHHDAHASNNCYLLVHDGSLPDQRPVSKHVLVSSPVRVYPVLQE